ncbi:MAG: putative metal-binding motif-containing protein [Myxococcota bacterium]|nr:putative metal-binding motif-containing protein [Myxococcota bacterium]
MLLLLSLACTWISDADVEERLDFVDDDGDGFTLNDGDCDDNDADSYPGAEEVWYDGVNQDCGDEEDFDADGDGYLGQQDGPDADCNDNNPDINPAATETWYDNIDSDCDGANDFDADGDGVMREPEGDDCDDTDVGINPTAIEVWYDGVDQNCDGGDDYDADLDGQAREPEGTDCDDTDATIYVGATETWYDGINSNCDEIDELGDYDQDADGAYHVDAGTEPVDCDDVDAEAFPGALEDVTDARDLDCVGGADVAATTDMGLTLVDPRSLTVTRGSTGTAAVAFLAVSASDGGSLSLGDAAVLFEYDQAPELGPTGTGSLLSTSALDEGLEISQADGSWVGVAGLKTTTGRSLYLKQYTTDTPNTWTATEAGLSNSFRDTAIAVDTDGSVHMVGCGTDGVQYMRVDDLSSATITLSDYTPGQPAELCQLYLDGSGTGVLGFADAGTGEYVTWGWDTTTSEISWVELDRDATVELQDLDWPKDGSETRAWIDDSTGTINITDATASWVETPAVAPEQMSWDRNPVTGTLYMSWVDSDGSVTFAYGDTTSGFVTSSFDLSYSASEVTLVTQDAGDTVLVVILGSTVASQVVMIAP